MSKKTVRSAGFNDIYTEIDCPLHARQHMVEAVVDTRLHFQTGEFDARRYAAVSSG